MFAFFKLCCPADPNSRVSSIHSCSILIPPATRRLIIQHNPVTIFLVVRRVKWSLIENIFEGSFHSKMAAESSETDLKTFRDFLIQYNSVTEQCFTVCVQDLTKRLLLSFIASFYSFHFREVTEKEERCAKNCLDKFLKMTQRLSMRFQEHQIITAEAQGGTLKR